MARSTAYHAPPFARPVAKHLVDAMRAEMHAGEVFTAFLDRLFDPFAAAARLGAAGKRASASPSAERSTGTPTTTSDRLARSISPAATEALAAAVTAYETTVREQPVFFDVLGPVYMAVGTSGHQQWLGQYFTPWPVAAMMASMHHDLPAVLEGRPESELITVCDPACGSGVMLLAFLAHVHEHGGAEAVSRVSVTGIDIDRICARMAAAQLLANWAIHELPIGEVQIYHGDTLRLDPMRLLVHASDARRVVQPSEAAVAPDKAIWRQDVAAD